MARMKGADQRSALVTFCIAVPVVLLGAVFGREGRPATTQPSATQYDPVVGVWQANPLYNEAGTWTIMLTRTDGALTGTVRQADMGPCEPDYWPIQAATTDGPNLSFVIVTSQGRSVVFKGTIQGDTIDFVRSVPGHMATDGQEAFGILAFAPTNFIARRVAATTQPPVAQHSHPNVQGVPISRLKENCFSPDFTAEPFALNTQVRLVAANVPFGPWAFDLAIGPDGVVTGSATQSQLDAKTMATSEPGPFAISSGQVWGEAIAFNLTYDNDEGRVDCEGVRHGADGVDFRCIGLLKGITAEPPAVRRVVAGRSVLVAAPHAERGLLTQDIFRFTARMVPSALDTAPPAAGS